MYTHAAAPVPDSKGGLGDKGRHNFPLCKKVVTISQLKISNLCEVVKEGKADKNETNLLHRSRGVLQPADVL